MEQDVERIKRLFGGDAFKFARWGGPICPMISGISDAGVRLFEEAIKAMVEVADHKMDEVDPEMGANLMIYVVGEWDQALTAPNLPNFLPNLTDLVARLKEADANRYRVFAFDDAGAIRAAITLLRYDDNMAQAPVDYLALTEAALALLVYDETGAAEDRPIVMAKFETEGDEEDEMRAVLHPWHARLIRAAYDQTIPAGSSDPALALRLAARIGVDDADEEDEDDA